MNDRIIQEMAARIANDAVTIAAQAATITQLQEALAETASPADVGEDVEQ